MIFTTKAEYGVRLLVELGRHEETGEPVSLKALADAEKLPLAYLERIVARLKKAGIVESTRGAHGGYRLARDAGDIRMDDVIVALEGQIAPMTCFVDEDDGNGEPGQRVICSHDIDRGQGCATRLLWTRVQAGVQRALATTTLADLVEFAERGPVATATTTGAAA